ncbi:FtsX-like permease family protein [Geminicoccus roseus]|uniref:FtsX-like permease family protein n=1 Tax=Geminicoccus roseus TaxID=404900 RepID=UPI000404996B|nr:FtsX-like permease family protein [Geminicoccus roseus]
MGNPLPFVLADLRRSRAGVLAVILLVALAVALGVAVSAQERALREGSAEAADPFDLLIGAPGSETQLVLSTVYLQPASLDLIDARILAELADNPEVAYAAPIGFGDNWQGHPLIGSTTDFLTRGGALALAEGRPFARVDEVVVGADVPLALEQEFEPLHGHVEMEDEDHHEFAFRVVGRLPRLGSPWDRAIVSSIESTWWIHGLPVGHALDEARVWPAGLHGEPDFSAIPVGPPFDLDELPGVPAIVVKPASFAAAYALRAQYRGADATMAVFPGEVLVQLYALLGDVRDLIATISVLTQVLVIGAVLLAVLASLAQRRRLIGVLRALGASRLFVFATVWLNVALILTLGALLGLALGYGGALLVSLAFESRTSVALPVALGHPEFLLVLAIVLVGLALAAIPAALTYRNSVAAALRS